MQLSAVEYEPTDCSWTATSWAATIALRALLPHSLPAVSAKAMSGSQVSAARSVTGILRSGFLQSVDVCGRPACHPVVRLLEDRFVAPGTELRHLLVGSAALQG